MTNTIPSAELSDNPLAAALSSGRVATEDLGPLAWHLNELVAANAASAALMAQRHHGSTMSAFYTVSAAAEQEAHQLLSPLIQAYPPPRDNETSLDPLALAYPGQIARIAVTGTPWDYPVCFLYLCRPSTRNYRQLHQAMSNTSAFDDRQLEHFEFFGHLDEEEITAVQGLIADTPNTVLTRARELARQLATCEQLFWERMVLLCTPRGASGV